MPTPLTPPWTHTSHTNSSDSTAFSITRFLAVISISATCLRDSCHTVLRPEILPKLNSVVTKCPQSLSFIHIPQSLHYLIRNIYPTSVESQTDTLRNTTPINPRSTCTLRRALHSTAPNNMLLRPAVYAHYHNTYGTTQHIGCIVRKINIEHNLINCMR